MKCLLSVLLFLSTSTVSAQWVKQRDPRVPSLRDGKPNLSAPTPRVSDGKPDLSGVGSIDASLSPAWVSAWCRGRNANTAPLQRYRGEHEAGRRANGAVGGSLAQAAHGESRL
jgi:hypothetical protein